MALVTADPLIVEPLQSAGDTEWLTAHKEANNMKKYTVKIQVDFLDVWPMNYAAQNLGYTK